MSVGGGWLIFRKYFNVGSAQRMRRQFRSACNIRQWLCVFDAYCYCCGQTYVSQYIPLPLTTSQNTNLTSTSLVTLLSHLNLTKSINGQGASSLKATTSQLCHTHSPMLSIAFHTTALHCRFAYSCQYVYLAACFFISWF